MISLSRVFSENLFQSEVYMNTGSMVYAIGASSLKNAVSAIHYKSKKEHEKRVTAISGLSLNPLSSKPLKNLQNLLRKGSSAKQQNLIIRQDIINNSLSVHWKTQTPALTPEELVKLLGHYRDRISAVCLLPQIWDA